MKKHSVLVGLVVAMIGILWIIYPTNTHAETLNGSIQLEETVHSPVSIADPVLLKALRYLFHQQEPFELWKGSSFSGKMLAQFILDHQIPVVWDWANICGAGSCSSQYCYRNSCTDCIKDRCVDKNGYPAPITIYINTTISDIPELAGTLAHEAFHKLHPFGNVPVTRYEEYWSYAVHQHITPSDWPSFDEVDPMIPDQLNCFFTQNGISGYDNIPLYPSGLAGVELNEAENDVQTITEP
jgi:hypothetical protein